MALVCRSLVLLRKEAVSPLPASRSSQRLIASLSSRSELHRDGKSAPKCGAHFLAGPLVSTSCHLLSTDAATTIPGPPLSPAVRYHVDTNKIYDISVIPATGPSNRLLKGDVLQYLEDLKAGKVVAMATTKPVSQVFKPVTPAPQAPSTVIQTPPKMKHQPLKSSSSYVDIPVNEMQREAAEREVYSKWSTPYSYATTTCNVDRVLETINKHKSEDQGNTVLSVDDFVIRSAGHTLQDIPESNGVWSGEGVRLLSSVDISVSVHRDEGMVSGVVKGVNRLSVDEIAAALKNLSSESVTTAQTSFSINSLSRSGVTEFTSILPPLHSAVLSIGSLQTVPSFNKNIVSHHIVVTLTSDPRVIHYALACRWLDLFKRTLELAI